MQLLNQSVQSFTDTDAHVLISLAGKVAELSLFKGDNIALSEAQIACWICLHVFIKSDEIERKKNRVTEIYT